MGGRTINKKPICIAHIAISKSEFATSWEGVRVSVMCVGVWVNDMVASQCTIAQYAHHNRSHHQAPEESGIDPHTYCSGRSCSIHH